MKEYVSKEYINNLLEHHLDDWHGPEHFACSVIQDELQDAPIADVTEVKHGFWIPVNTQHGNETDGHWTERKLQCSICNYEHRDVFIPQHKPLYCENCGSKMDKEN